MSPVLLKIFYLQLVLLFAHAAIEKVHQQVLASSKAPDAVSNGTLACPTWYIPTTEGCSCGTTRGHLLQCYGHQRVRLEVTYCMSLDEVTQQVFIVSCPYVNQDIYKDVFVEQPQDPSQLNEQLCGWANRTGFLCQRCKDGLGVATMTYRRTCLECIGPLKGWFLYFFLAFAPATIFFIVIVFCRIRTTSEKMNSMVCIFQVIVFYINKYPNSVGELTDESRGNFYLMTMATIGGIWNLEFFRYVMPPFCISENLTMLNILAMEYIVAVYPFVLTFFLYVCIKLYSRDFKPVLYMWWPFKLCLSKMKFKVDVKSSTIDAFATLLQLSYSKLIFVSLTLLIEIEPEDINAVYTNKYFLYYDPEVPYLSQKHVPYFILSLTIILIFILSPVVLLLVYPTKAFQKLLGLFPRINWLPLHAFDEAFNGCYKNGTNGTRDYRFFGAVFLIIRLLFFLSAILPLYNESIFITVAPLILVVIFAVFRPYKSDFYNKLDVFYWLSLQLILILILSNLHFIPVPLYIPGILGAIPCIHMAILIINQLLVILCPTFYVKMKKALHWTSVPSVGGNSSPASSQSRLESTSVDTSGYSSNESSTAN